MSSVDGISGSQGTPNIPQLGEGQSASLKKRIETSQNSPENFKQNFEKSSFINKSDNELALDEEVLKKAFLNPRKFNQAFMANFMSDEPLFNQK
jgi:hypothetical protein